MKCSFSSHQTLLFLMGNYKQNESLGILYYESLQHKNMLPNIYTLSTENDIDLRIGKA